MSGDVQPRKRKDKKRKKDELGVEEPRGTAAVLGEGDVFMHSYHEHGTGGHWCAKVIFFSLLAVLITLIGLIILENRGLTELEANSVESRYSGVLEGWLEDAPDDDHHDEHTLELLKQHEDEEDDHDPAHDISLEDDHDEADHDDDDHDEADHEDDDDDHDEGDQDDDDDNDENESAHDDEDNDDVNNQDNDEDDQEESNEDRKDDDDDDDDDDEEEEDGQHLEESNEDNDDDDDEEPANRNNENDEENDDDDLQKVDENDTAEDNDGDDDDDDEDDDDDNLQNQADDRSVENDDDDNDDDRNIDDDENSREDENDDEEHEEHEEEEGDSEIEVEKLEHEVSDNDAASEEQHTQEVEEDDDKSQEDSTEVPPEDSGEADDDGIEDEEFLEADDEPVVERIVVPKGKPLAEVEDEPTTAKPVDTLADEEEYEKQQEQLRREEAQASHVWLKLIVGGALLVATHAVVSRAVAPRDDTPASEGHASREDTPSMIDRRMTLIPEETAPVPASSDIVEEIIRPVIEEKVFGKYSQFVKSEPPPKEESEDEEIEEEEEEVIIDMKEAVAPAVIETEDKELYSDEEEAEEEIVVEKKEAPKQATPVPAKVKDPEPEEEPEEDVPDDVEIIDDEQLEEELEEEEDDEEEISDVDDAELLTRLEAKYGRLPEPERPGPKNKDGGNSIEDDWPGEPADKYWRQQLDEAEQELRQGAWSAAEARASAPELRPSARAMWTKARALDAGAAVKRDNRLLTRAITAYLEVLKLNERLSDAKLREIAHRTLDRIRFRGTYLSAEPVYRLLIRRFPEDVEYRNNMTVSFLMADRADLAEEVIKETLQKWPNDRIALAHHGFILKTKHNRLEEAVEAFQKALQGDIGPATEPRFYYHLGDSLLLLSRFAEAQEVHKRGAKLGHFLSPAQRSLYNVERLKSRPWWNIEETPYLKLARALEKSWQDILKEGLAAQALYEKEKEGLKERGEWSQLDLFVRGQEVPGRCKKAPVTCSIVRGEVAAAGCRRGQIKFSSMEAGTHVRPHVGPTNCRLRMHLGLSNTKDTYIRVDQETRQWQVGKVLMFDDSFEHEVWHNGTGTRLVLIVDVWHPALSPAERRDLPPI